MSIFQTSFYRRSPIWLQELVIGGRALARKSLREGHSFRDAIRELEETQWLSATELRDYQLERLRGIVDHAARHVPYYSELFKRLGVSVETWDDFRKIPYLSKADVVSAGNSLIANVGRAFRMKAPTSGTTGLSLVTHRDLKMVIREHAFIRRQMEWAGWKPGQRRAWIRGDRIVPLTEQRMPFWRYDRVEKMLMMSSFHFRHENAREFISALESFDPVLILAFPSSISFLARFLVNDDSKYKAPSLKGILTSSETLTGEQRRLVSLGFQCPVFDFYGSVEGVAAIGTCQHGSYHVMSDYGFTELLPAVDGTKELVGTGFHNLTMPLIRYNSNDVVVPDESNEPCPCGRWFPRVKRIEGRIHDFVKLPDGRRIGNIGVILDGANSIWEAQIVQDRLDQLNILVVPMQSFQDKDRETLRQRAIDMVGPRMTVDVQTVDEIPRTDAGKFRGVICSV